MPDNPTPPQVHAAIIAAVSRAEAGNEERGYLDVLCKTWPAYEDSWYTLADGIVPVALRGWRADAEYALTCYEAQMRGHFAALKVEPCDDDEQELLEEDAADSLTNAEHHAARLLTIARLVVSALPPEMCAELTALGVEGE